MLKGVKDFLMIGLLILGTAAFLYPFLGEVVTTYLEEQVVAIYQQKLNQQGKKEREKVYKKLQTKNAGLAKKASVIGDDLFKKEATAKKPTLDYYAQHTLGKIKIPVIGIELPIFDDTNERFLSRGAGLLAGTSYPIGGINTHTVLSSHRGLMNAKLFTDLPQVKLKDHFYIENQKETLAYQVDWIKIIEPTETELLAIIPGKDRATLMTCTPYMVNSHRLLVSGKRIAYTPKLAQEIKKGRSRKLLRRYGYLLGSLLFVFLAGRVVYKKVSIMISRRKKYVLNFIFLAEDKPVTGMVFSLYSQKGKQLTREGKAYQVVSDAFGRVSFEQLAGGIYQLNFQDVFLKVGVKKLRASSLSFLSGKQLKKAQLILVEKDQQQFLVQVAGRRKNTNFF